MINLISICRDLIYNLEMGKKAQKAKKQPVSAKTSKIEKTPKSAKKKVDQASQVALFSDNFYSKISEFKDLYTLVNSNISDSGRGDAFNLEQKFKEVSVALEKQSSIVLERHLTEAEKWINHEIDSLKQKLIKLEKHQSDARQIFENSNVLSEKQIEESLVSLKNKINEKRDQLNNYQNLLTRSKDVYA